MIPTITLLVVLTVSLLVTRIATVALTYTGLSKEVARFQARSAFTGVGFTTGEAEKVVNHPVRRRILLLLMLFGNAGIVTAIASVVMTFVSIEGKGSTFWQLTILTLGLVALWIIAVNKWVDSRLSKIIGWALKRYTKLDVRDYVSLLHMAGEYKVSELYVEDGDWLANRQLQEIRLQDEGVMILGITRKDGTYLGAPDGSMQINAGDNLILYGRDSAFKELDERQRGYNGDLKHQIAIEEQKKVVEEEQSIDRGDLRADKN